MDLKDSAGGYAIYSFLNISTVVYISLVCANTDVLYLSTIYFGIFYLTRINKRLAKETSECIRFEDLREFTRNHMAIIKVFKGVQRLSKTFMLIMYFSNLSMTCFIGLVLTMVKELRVLPRLFTVAD